MREAIKLLNLTTIQFLIRMNADVNQLNRSGENCLFDVIAKITEGQKIKLGFDNRFISITNLQSGQIIINYLLSCGANPLIKNCEETTAVDYAKQKNYRLRDNIVALAINQINGSPIDITYKYPFIKSLENCAKNCEIAQRAYEEINNLEVVPTDISQIISEYLDKHIAKRRPIE